MSEVAGIDLATSLLHLADRGGRASTILCIFSGQLKTADPSNASVSADSDHIVSVLQKLHNIHLKSDDLSTSLDGNVAAARALVAECYEAIERLSTWLNAQALDSTVDRPGEQHFNWRCSGPRFDRVRSVLQQLKTSFILISLMLVCDQVPAIQLKMAITLLEKQNASEEMIQFFLRAVEEAKLGGAPLPYSAARATAPLATTATSNGTSNPKGGRWLPRRRATFTSSSTFVSL